MPKLRPDQLPSYRLHRQSGQAIVTLAGRDHLLGDFGTPASRQRYDRLVAEWLAADRRPLTGQPGATPHKPATLATLSISRVGAAFITYAERYYVTAAGKPTGEATNFWEAIRVMMRLYGRTPAVEFGPLKLKAVREAMVKAGWCRMTVNRQVNRLRRVFAWAVEEELIPGEVYHRLRAVKALAAGRSDAKESEPVQPVADDVIEKTLPHLSPTVATMVQLQRLTGMRPGELLALRVGDIDTSGDPWLYKPPHHKTSHHNQTRVIPIGPRGRELLTPYLTLNRDACVFSPSRAAEEVRERRHAARKTPLSCGNRPGTNRRRKPKREPGDRYSSDSYRRAIARACEAAEVPAWTPYQLRHAAGTQWGHTLPEATVQALLGHTTRRMLSVYCKPNLQHAADVARQIG